MAAAGARPRSNRPLDGVDVIGDLVSGRPAKPRTLFWRARRADRTWRAVRSGDLKYVSLQDGDGFQEHVYNVSNDPGETNDLKTLDAASLAQLKGSLADWEEEMKQSAEAAKPSVAR